MVLQALVQLARPGHISRYLKVSLIFAGIFLFGLVGHHLAWAWSEADGKLCGRVYCIIPFLTMIYLVLTLLISPEGQKVLSSSLAGQL